MTREDSTSHRNPSCSSPVTPAMAAVPVLTATPMVTLGWWTGFAILALTCLSFSQGMPAPFRLVGH